MFKVNCYKDSDRLLPSTLASPKNFLHIISDDSSAFPLSNYCYKFSMAPQLTKEKMKTIKTRKTPSPSWSESNILSSLSLFFLTTFSINQTNIYWVHKMFKVLLLAIGLQLWTMYSWSMPMGAFYYLVIMNTIKQLIFNSRYYKY